MATQKKKYLTLIVVPDASSQFRQIRIPYALVILLLIGGILLIGTIPVGVYLLTLRYSQMQQVATNLPKMRKETKDQRFLMEQYERDVGELRQIVSRLKLENAKLMRETGIEQVPEMPANFLGMGGADQQELAMILETLQQESEDAAVKKIENLAKLKAYATDQEALSQRLMEFFQDQKTLLASMPSIWPARGWVTSDFGTRTSPFTNKKTMHYGLDIATTTGSPIIAPADGIVSFSGNQEGFGKVLVIDHGYGFSTFYGHCSALKKKVGDKIKRGDLIALVGNTGTSTGPHLHYEVRVNGVATNPAKYILD